LKCGFYVFHNDFKFAQHVPFRVLPRVLCGAGVVIGAI